MFSKETEEILEIGKSLSSVGINNWALTKTEAMLVLEKLHSLEVPVLGGDVYEMIDGILQPNYDNWYCDPLNEEARKDFVNRSIDKARSYIEGYTLKDFNSVFFVLVPDA